MHKGILFTSIIISIISTSLSNAQQRDIFLTDIDGNKYPLKVFSGNWWITENLKLKIPDSNCYDNQEQNCKTYGRLYTWTSAKKGCAMLGDGWRLPTAKEWQQLKMLYGDVKKDSIATGKKAYKALLSPGKSQFNAVLGGGRNLDGKYSRIDAHGFYWTTTQSDSTTAWFYNFGKGIKFLGYIIDGEKSRALSVRCVKRSALK
jgi:uncharacterized protein (TIGR02145 family)